MQHKNPDIAIPAIVIWIQIAEKDKLLIKVNLNDLEILQFPG